MALPGHSPPPSLGPGSPPRTVNGHSESSLPPPPPPPPTMYGSSHPMLPPSPSHFQPRYPGPSPSFQDSRLPQPPPPPPSHKRPSSSMSISSMLGTEPEKPPHESYLHLNSHPSSRQGSFSASSMPLGNLMSPPHQPARAGAEEYSYKPRSQTPDRLGSVLVGSRQRSASSGTSMPPYAGFDTHRDAFNTRAPPHYGPPAFNTTSGPSSQEEHTERTRRTSLSGILQRPNSQPQAGSVDSASAPPFTTASYPAPGYYLQPGTQRVEGPMANGMSSSYDTRPPGMGDATRPAAVQTSPQAQIPSLSPESRRAMTNGNYNRGLAGILNGPTSQPTDSFSSGSQNMMRQDSAQSQSDRSNFGDRGRFRHYSPFAGSVTSQHGSSGPFDEQGRKGSDEIAHKAIVGLGLDNKRGRYSPVPQAVQGAQAQTPVPDGGVKSEQGRVFSGIGGGIGVSSSVPTPMSGPLPASPFKRDAALAQQLDDGSTKMSRTASNVSKRMRKHQDDDDRLDGDVFEGKKSGTKGNKRTKYQNSYKADLEEMAASGFQPRNSPYTGLNSGRAVNAPFNGISMSHAAQKFDTTPIFKPKKTVKVATVMNSTVKKPRRHLGNFAYEPQILVPDAAAIGDPGFDICIVPKLLPAFTETEHLNCTYSVRISKTWLQDPERRIICSTRNLWGSGLYTDDSDPLAAAMHMGWIRSSHSRGVDETLLAKVIDEQNPKIEVSKDFAPPTQPLDIKPGQDLKITLVTMPQLERYEESVRYGVRSRPWPEGLEKTPHDGVSFAIFKVEFLDIGPEERRSGRTGESKRKRIRAQMEARQRTERAEQVRLEKLKKRQHDKKGKNATSGVIKSRQAKEAKAEDAPGSVTASSAPVQKPKGMEMLSNTEREEWRRQVATAAA